MIAASTLSLFLLALAALFLSPGPNMAFVISHGVAYGARGGLAAALGIGASDVVMTLLTATGVTALVAAWPPAFDILRIGGALYLLKLAIGALRARGPLDLGGRRETDLRAIFRAAMLNSMLNPKALLFFIVFLPQFVDAARPVMPQILVLGAILTVASLAFHGLLGIAGARLAGMFARQPRLAAAQGWFLAAVMLGLALRLLWLERPAAR